MLRKLERQLISLHPAEVDLKAHRFYPLVVPKFANPDEPSQVWSGRGVRPRWVTEKLASGLSLGDLIIGRGSCVAIPQDHLIGERAEEPRKESQKVRSR